MVKWVSAQRLKFGRPAGGSRTGTQACAAASTGLCYGWAAGQARWPVLGWYKVSRHSGGHSRSVRRSLRCVEPPRPSRGKAIPFSSAVGIMTFSGLLTIPASLCSRMCPFGQLPAATAPVTQVVGPLSRNFGQGLALAFQRRPHCRYRVGRRAAATRQRRRHSIPAWNCSCGWRLASAPLEPANGDQIGFIGEFMTAADWIRRGVPLTTSWRKAATPTRIITASHFGCTATESSRPPLLGNTDFAGARSLLRRGAGVRNIYMRFTTVCRARHKRFTQPACNDARHEGLLCLRLQRAARPSPGIRNRLFMADDIAAAAGGRLGAPVALGCDPQQKPNKETETK